MRPTTQRILSYSLHKLIYLGDLKVLSSEMDPVETIGSFDISLLKVVCGGFLEKSARPPSSESPLNFRAPPCF